MSRAHAPFTASGPSALIPQRPSARAIVDNDFAGDPDGLIALAHQLLSPKTRVPLVTVSALNPRFAGARAGTTVRQGQEDVFAMLERGRFGERPRVIPGSEVFDLSASAAAVAIAEEAMRDDPLPLFVACGGPLTNVAAALRHRPEIARRMTVVWIGGGPYPEGGDEYNLATDPAAARIIIEESSLPFWQIPADTYRRLQVSVAEMTVDFRSISPLTRWLYERYTELPEWVELGGSLTMGDSPLPLLTAVAENAGRYRTMNARTIAEDLSYGPELEGRRIRIYDEIDARLLWADKLAACRLEASAGAS